ncbi:MAG: NAD(P)H-hydrate epimerase [Clostridiales bacterium]|nr:NAD(P)H-hydrate epimerase [Clostridiales bacterium]
MNKYTVAQVQAAERRAETEFGIPLSQLMDNAGKALARAALEMCPDGPVVIFCGKGNNGGDGYVCAAALQRQGLDVTVWGIGRETLAPDSLAGAAAAAFENAGGKILPFTPETFVPPQCGLMIDALFGTGLTRPPAGLYAQAIAAINAAGRPVLSCDIPSGVNADTGEILGDAVRADKTLVLGLAKLACDLPPGDKCFGTWQLADIGI